MAGEKSVTPKTGSGTGSVPSALVDLFKSFGGDSSKIPSPGDSKKKTKSGLYTRTYVTTTIPNDITLTDNINKIFEKYYGRDATQQEIATWLPQLKAKYSTKEGKQQSTVKETYDNGVLKSTEYLTADNLDPSTWLEDTIQTRLAEGNIAVSKLGIPEGPAGQYFTAFKEFAYKNGIQLSDSAASDYANKVVAGKLDNNTVISTLQESAASAFPQLADKIKSGIDVKTLADPYIQSMANTLEIPAAAIDLFDPKIRSALAYTLPDGKVGTKSIYDFERELRQDERWQYTNQARKEVADATLGILRDFGLQG
jgi:hypothetical protein